MSSYASTLEVLCHISTASNNSERGEAVDLSGLTTNKEFQELLDSLANDINATYLVPVENIEKNADKLLSLLEDRNSYVWSNKVSLEFDEVVASKLFILLAAKLLADRGLNELELTHDFLYHKLQKLQDLVF